MEVPPECERQDPEDSEEHSRLGHDTFRTLLDRAGLDIERIAELPMETTALITAPRPSPSAQRLSRTGQP